MIKFLNEAICSFRKCFTRLATFSWFVVIVIGIMVRTDRLGATSSVMRSLGLYSQYESLNKYFRSDAWNLHDMEKSWGHYINANAPVVRVAGAAVLPGDGIKVAKEGKRMPGVKRLHQESENSSKPEYIHGLMFGSIGVLVEKNDKEFCVPLGCEVQDGIREIMSWEYKEGERQGSHVVETIKLGHRVSEPFGNSILLLDRYFQTAPAYKQLAELNDNNERVQAIIMAKSNAIAYEEPPIRTPRTRGRPRLKGESVKLLSLFNEKAGEFKTVSLKIYGNKQDIRYYSTDLLWGKGLYRKLRFVLVEYGDTRTIISCTDLSLDPAEIVRLYSKRFKIECTFKSMNQDVAAFANRFWTHDMPKLNRFAKSSDPDRSTGIKDERARRNVRKALDASEGYVFCGAVALGLLQMLSLLFFNGDTGLKLRYLRTSSKTVPSEATVADWLRKNIFRLLPTNKDLTISQIILGKMDANLAFYEDATA